MTGETAPADSSATRYGRRHRQHQPGPVATGGVNGGARTIVFSKVSRTTASAAEAGSGGHHYQEGPSAGGPLSLKFSQVIGNRAARACAAAATPGLRSASVLASITRQAAQQRRGASS
jgi:hypothetical protein